MTPEQTNQTRSWPECAVAILNNDNTAIVVDDHCYAIRNWIDGSWGWSPHIFTEALAIIKSLPDNPDDALRELEDKILAS